MTPPADGGSMVVLFLYESVPGTMEKYVSPALYGIIGHPIAHSLSPLLHTTAFRAAGFPGILLPWDIAPGELPAFVRSVRTLNIRGSCITIPHKQGMLPLVDSLTGRARAVGAVNTLYRDGGAILGDNTDVPGFSAPLAKKALDASLPVLLLGAGGAARAAVVGLLEYGFRRIAIAGRSGAAAAALADEFGVDAVVWEKRGEADAGLVVNTTPLGMTGAGESETPFDRDWFSGRSGTVYDTIYTPRATRFMREAEEAGWAAVGGLGMFIGQAECQFSLWTGLSLPVEAKNAVVRALYGPGVELAAVDI